MPKHNLPSSFLYRNQEGDRFSVKYTVEVYLGTPHPSFQVEKTIKIVNTLYGPDCFKEAYSVLSHEFEKPDT